MKSSASIVCIIGLSIVLIGCGGVPEANTVNCSGRGMEIALAELKDDEVARQAFLDKCNEIAREQ